MTSVVRVRRENGNIVQDCDIYIGRECRRGGWDLPESKWSNPFSVTKYGRDRCLEMYRIYIEKKIDEDPHTYDLNELKGKILGCWCHPSKCHGDILVELCNRQ